MGAVAGARHLDRTEHHAAADEALAAAQPGTHAHARAIVDAHANGDDEAMAAIYAVPETAARYDLPPVRARQLGLQTDAGAEIKLRQAFPAAEVPKSIATTLYWAALNAATIKDQSPAAIETEYRQSAHALHRKWGNEYAANLALANAEARRVYEKLPQSITKGASFADFCRVSGIANSRLVVEMFLARAKARAR